MDPEVSPFACPRSCSGLPCCFCSLDYMRRCAGHLRDADFILKVDHSLMTALVCRVWRRYPRRIQC